MMQCFQNAHGSRTAPIALRERSPAHLAQIERLGHVSISSGFSAIDICEELPLHSSRQHSKPPICLPKRMEGRMAFSVTATEVGAKARLRLL
jgi:hypothetical protein